MMLKTDEQSNASTETAELPPGLEMKTSRQPKQTVWTGWRLLVGEAFLIMAAFVVSYYLRYEVQLFQPVDEVNAAPFAPFIPYALLFMAWLLIANQSAGLYADRRGRTLASELISIANSATNAGLLIMALSFLFRPLVFSRLMIIQAVVLTIIFLAIWRFAIRNVKHHLQKRGIGVDHVLVVGADELGLAVIRTMVARPDLGYRPIGFIDDDPERNSQDLGRVTALGPIDNLAPQLDKHSVDLVIVTLPWERHQDIVRIVQQCQRYGVDVRTVPDLFQLNLSQMQVESLGGIPLLGLHRPVKFNPANHVIKRIVDLVLIALTIPISLPIIALIALAIRLETPGPPFFTQERVGMNGRIFKMLKFRSMVQNADEMWESIMTQTNEDLRRPKLADDPRVTRVGRFLRITSLDELPNIFNVLRGDMSLIGPRPQVPREVALYAPWQYQRLKVRPGMTGLWQISGRSEVPFDEMVLMDIYYIENWSLLLDFQILLQTAPRVLFRTGAY